MRVVADATQSEAWVVCRDLQTCLRYERSVGQTLAAFAAVGGGRGAAPARDSQRAGLRRLTPVTARAAHHLSAGQLSRDSLPGGDVESRDK